VTDGGAGSTARKKVLYTPRQRPAGRRRSISIASDGPADGPYSQQHDRPPVGVSDTATIDAMCLRHLSRPVLSLAAAAAAAAAASKSEFYESTS